MPSLSGGGPKYLSPVFFFQKTISFYYWDLRRPLHQQSCQGLPFMLIVFAEQISRKTQATQGNMVCLFL